MPHRILAVLFALTLAIGAGAEPAAGPDVSDPKKTTGDESPPTDRVVIVPLNLAVRAPAELEGKGDPVWHALLDHLSEQDRQVAVLNPISAERLWLEATRDLDLSDRAAALREGTVRFARQLARHREFDLVVIPSLVLRPAHLSGHHASWDGVQREVPNAARLMSEVTAGFDASGPIRVDGLRGKIGAASLHASVLRSDGTEVFQGLGGLDVLQEVQRVGPWDTRIQFVNRTSPFSDPGALREGVQRALGGPALAVARAR